MQDEKIKGDSAKGRVLILDGRQRSTLAAVRSLGKLGLAVTVGEDSLPCLASKSKFVANSIRYASALSDPKGFISDVAHELSRYKYDMILPMTDITMSLVMNEFENLSRSTDIPVAGKESYLKAIDKGKIIELSQSLDIPTPKTYFINDLSELNRIRSELNYPVVIKPRQSKYLTSSGWIDAGVDYAYSFDELNRKLEIYKNSPCLPLIQERVSGPGIGAFLLFNRGEVKACFFHRRIREKPPSGGVSTLRDSIAPDPVVKDYSIRLLKALNWHGVAMVEFKQDSRDGTPRIMEINARFWGSLQLAIDSGIDFPAMLYQMTTTGDVPSKFDYEIGVKSRWLLGDLDHLLARLLKSDSSLRLPLNYPGRIATLVGFLKFYQPKMKYEVLRFDDIRPFLFELKEWLKQLTK
ncbi:MAG TPA: carboxylate--amine ligase [candidate division Zixibacteria bacterium]|nr:carboxylate--amine ligase [candidate division Zixibacteria bacterium]HBZ01295.1 carboxylate--amine ligase [candidate division Zixibacteria bacterium]